MKLLKSAQTFLLVIAIVTAPQQAKSALLGFDVGLDGSSRDLLERLPDDIRKQFIKALQEALPLVDKSVEKYLNSVDGIVSNGIMRARCAAAGTWKDVDDSVNRFLTRLNPLPTSSVGTAPKNTPIPIQTIARDVQETRRLMRSGDTASDLSLSYADLLYRIGLVACQVEGVSPMAMKEISRINADIARSALTWMRLAGICETPTDCYVKRYMEVDQLAQSSEIHDAQNVKAFDRIKNLPSPSDEPGRITRAFQTFDLDRYEKNLSELHFIEQGIIISRDIRLVTEKELNAGGQALNSVDGQIKTQIAIAKGRDANVYHSAAKALEATLPVIKDAMVHLDAAATGSVFLRAKAQEGLARGRAMEKDVRNYISRWNAKAYEIFESGQAQADRDARRMVR